MDTQFILAILLTFFPFVELRGGLPVIIDYCLKNGLNIWPYFSLVVFLNCLITLFVFFFMNYLHRYFLRYKNYKYFIERHLLKIRKKADVFEKKFDALGFLALAIFVAIPLPGTGAWTGAFVAWALELDKKKSFAWISLGVLGAGIIVLLVSLGIFNFF